MPPLFPSVCLNLFLSGKQQRLLHVHEDLKTSADRLTNKLKDISAILESKNEARSLFNFFVKFGFCWSTMVFEGTSQ